MVANDVATAIFTAYSCGNPLAARMKVIKGTISMPPPMPRSPAKKPVDAPNRSNSKISRGSTVMKVGLTPKAARVK